MKKILLLGSLLLLSWNIRPQRIIDVPNTGRFANYVFSYYGSVSDKSTQILRSVFEYINETPHKRPKRLFIVFNSGGGSVNAMWQQIALIEHYKQKGIQIETVLFDACHSACVNLFLTGSIRHVMYNSYMIIHQARIGGMGLLPPEEILKLKKGAKQSINHQCGKLNMSDIECEEYFERTKSNLTLFPDDLLLYGYAHYIISDYRDLIFKED